MTGNPMRCARCGKRLRADGLYVYSRWTRNHYCFDMDACGRRAKRKTGTDDGAVTGAETPRGEDAASV